MAKIDEIDMKIIAELSRDASISIPRLSEKIKVNSSVVYSRIKRLARRKIIRRFTIEVNDEALGWNVSALVGLNIDSKYRDELLEEVLHLGSVREIYEVTGRFDLIIKVKARSLAELHETVSAKIGRIGGILHSETFIEMRRREGEVSYPVQQT